MTTSVAAPGRHPGGDWRLADRDISCTGYGAMQLERLHTDPAAPVPCSGGLPS